MLAPDVGRACRGCGRMLGGSAISRPVCKHAAAGPARVRRRTLMLSIAHGAFVKSLIERKDRKKERKKEKKNHCGSFLLLSTHI